MIAQILIIVIEAVIINQNQNALIIQDDVLAQRIGLIPIFADANNFFHKTLVDFNDKKIMGYLNKI